jgi:hypothetical protein
MIQRAGTTARTTLPAAMTLTHNFGYVRVADYNGAGTKVYDTGSVWTNCQVGGIALISVNGYFLTRCWNSGTGGMYIYCETDRP